MKFINIGFGNMVSVSKIVSIVSPESAPIKRIVSDAKGKKELIDASCGRRTRAVLITNSNHIILSALTPETIVGRLKEETNFSKEESEKDV